MVSLDHVYGTFVLETMAAEVIIISDGDSDSYDGDDDVDMLPKCLFTVKKEPLSDSDDSDRIEDAVLDAEGVLNEDTVLDEDVYVDRYLKTCLLCMAACRINQVARLQSLYVG